MIQCLACKKAIPEGLVRCPTCGALSPSIRRGASQVDRTVFHQKLLLGVVFGLLFIGWLWFFFLAPGSGNEVVETKQASVKPAQTPREPAPEPGETESSDTTEAVPVAAPEDSPPPEKRISDAYQNPQAELHSDTAEVIRFHVRISQNMLHGTWQIYFGEKLFLSQRSPDEITFTPFRNYSVAIRGGTLQVPLIKDFFARPGMNSEDNFLLASELGAGVYEIEVYIHASYVDEEGQVQLIRTSIPTLKVEN